MSTFQSKLKLLCCWQGECKSRSALRGNELQASVRRLGRKDKSKPKTRSNQDNNINNNSECFIWLSRIYFSEAQRLQSIVFKNVTDSKSKDGSS